MALLEILGPSAIPTLICLAVGLLLLLIELFTPGVGISGVLGIVSLVAVIVMQLFWGSPAAAAYIAAGTLVLIVVALLFLDRKALAHVDYPLLLTFLFFFVPIHKTPPT